MASQLPSSSSCAQARRHTLSQAAQCSNTHTPPHVQELPHTDTWRGADTTATHSPGSQAVQRSGRVLDTPPALHADPYGGTGGSPPPRMHPHTAYACVPTDQTPDVEGRAGRPLRATPFPYDVAPTPNRHETTRPATANCRSPPPVLTPNQRHQQPWMLPCPPTLKATALPSPSRCTPANNSLGGPPRARTPTPAAADATAHHRGRPSMLRHTTDPAPRLPPPPLRAHLKKAGWTPPQQRGAAACSLPQRTSSPPNSSSTLDLSLPAPWGWPLTVSCRCEEHRPA